jgi:hypothetical protein
MKSGSIYAPFSALRAKSPYFHNPGGTGREALNLEVLKATRIQGDERVRVMEPV